MTSLKCLLTNVLVVALVASSATWARAQCVGLGFAPDEGKFTGTLNSASVTANKIGGPGCDVDTLLCVRLYFNDEIVSETCAGDGDAPSLVTAITFDNLHFAHGTEIRLRGQYKYKRLDGTEHWSEIVDGPTIPVYNRIAVWHDGKFGTPMMKLGSGAWSGSSASWQYSTEYIDTATWTRDDYLERLTDRTANYVFAHGGTYCSGDGFIEPPGRGGHISQDNVPPRIDQSLANGNPPLAFALLMNCRSGANTTLPMAFLHGKSSLTNRFALAFKLNVEAQKVSEMVVQLTSFVSQGYAALEAATRAHDAVAWPTNRSFAARCQFVGDPAAKVKYVYDGDPSRKSTGWKR